MAPEIIQEKQSSFTFDIWSLGIVLFQMMTLQVPFHRNIISQLIDQILHETIPPLFEKYSNELKDIVREMLVKDSYCRIKLSKILKHSTLFLNKHEPNQQNEPDRILFLENENVRLQSENKILKDQVQNLTIANQNLEDELQKQVLLKQQFQQKYE
jgi:serine/threonine protein kinase